MSCNAGIMRWSRNIFTPNLYWVTDLFIFGCIIENGLPSRLLENLTSLKSLTISGSGSVIKGLVAPDALAGLPKILSIIFVRPTVSTGRLPPGFFDGLNTLTQITLRFAKLVSIPPTWFKGLAGLEKINFRNNNLQTLPSGLFDGLGSLMEVKLADNPWDCSCELRWLLDWSDITDEVVCQSPTSVQNVALETAASLLNCTPTTPTVRSISVSFDLETMETQINSITTFEVPMISSVSTFPNKDRIASTFTLTKPLSMPKSTIVTTSILNTTPRPGTSTVASTLITSFGEPNFISLLADATKDKVRATRSASKSSSIFSAHSTFVQAVSSSMPRKNSCLSNRNASNDFDIRSIIIISSVSVFTLIIVLAALLYRCVYRNKVTRK